MGETFDGWGVMGPEKGANDVPLLGELIENAREERDRGPTLTEAIDGLLRILRTVLPDAIKGHAVYLTLHMGEFPSPIRVDAFREGCPRLYPIDLPDFPRTAYWRLRHEGVEGGKISLFLCEEEGSPDTYMMRIALR